MPPIAKSNDTNSMQAEPSQSFPNLSKSNSKTESCYNIPNISGGNSVYGEKFPTSKQIVETEVNLYIIF
jgi:hypothetical protein